jgi:hypothetical protein
LLKSFAAPLLRPRAAPRAPAPPAHRPRAAPPMCGCAGGCTGGCAARACCGVPPKWAAWGFFLGFLAVTVVSWVLRDYGGAALDFGGAAGCSTGAPPTCGDLAVLRLALGSVLFFSIMLLGTLGVTTPTNPRAALHTGLWPLKYLVWAALCASCFAMPDSAIYGFQQAARVFSAIFILLQLVILLDLFYQANEFLLERECGAPFLIGATVLLIGGGIVGIGFLYKARVAAFYYVLIIIISIAPLAALRSDALLD